MSSATRTFTVLSTSFANGAAIPDRFTCEGVDRAPALSWSNVPDRTRSLALIAEDPDAPAGTWTHWLIWNIPPKPPSLPEGTPKLPLLPSHARQGRNDFHRIGYGGPCPPPGKLHHYIFKLYALDATLPLRPGASKADLESALAPHILAETSWTGTCKR